MPISLRAVATAALMAWCSGVACADATDATTAAPASTPPPGCAPVEWSALAPDGWDAGTHIRALGLDRMDEGDPAAVEATKALRVRWDAAQPRPGAAGRNVCLAGYVVPLSGGGGPLSEFLLVPYFGACIHEPAPPANQTVRVRPATPIDPQHRGSGAVWVTGTLAVARSESFYGVSVYRIDGARVHPRAGPDGPPDLAAAGHTELAHGPHSAR